MEIELPDGTILEAPDDADPSVVAKSYLSKQKRAATIKSNPSEYDPSSPEFRAKYGALSGMSDDDVFMAGAGKAVTDLGRGIKQIGTWAMDTVSPQKTISSLVTGEDSSRLGQLRQQQDEVNRRDAELMSTGNGVAGNITGNLATMLTGGRLLGAAPGALGAVGSGLINPQSIRAAALGGAALGAMQPVGTEQSRLENVALGAGTSALTQGAVQGIGLIKDPVKNALSATGKKAVQTLERAGVRLDAVQKTGSERLAQLKRMLTDNPFTSSGQVKQAQDTATSFTRAALKTVGENSDVANEQTVANAFTRIGSEFDRVATNNPIKADNQLLNDLVRVTQAAKAELESPQAAVISNQVDEIVNKAANGAIDGKAYQGIKGVLDRISGGANAQLGHWARELRSALDDALERSASQADVEALKTARTQYRNLMGLVKGVNPDGMVSPKKLYNAMNTLAYGGKKAMATGKGTDLMQLAKAGSQVIPEKMPNSGTTPRAMLQIAAPALAGGAYGYSQGGDPLQAAGYAAVGLGAPWLAQKAINNPAMANYLASGLQSPAARGFLSVPQSPLLRQLPTAGLLSANSEQ